MTTSEQILNIRSKAGNLNLKCPKCGNDPSNPYREYSKWGRIKNGCVDAIHTGQLITISDSNHWHNRKEAESLRKAELKHLKSLK